MRLDEVTHAAEVPSLERGAKIVDVAGINIWIFTLLRGQSVKKMFGEHF